jgi:ankyrin repeat protein
MANRQVQQLAGPALVVVGAVALILVGMYVPGSPGAKAADPGLAGNKSPVPADPAAGQALPRDARADATTALLDASVRGDAVAIRLALAKGADANRRYEGADKDLAGMTPLMLAARSGTFDSVNALVDAGADVDARTATGVTALMLAAGSSAEHTLEALLSAGADLNARTDSGETALLMAVRHGDASRVHSLLEAGASPDLPDATGTTPLMAAAERSELDKVMYLLDAGAQPATPDNSGKTALSRVSTKSDETSKQIASILLEAAPH